MNVYVKIANDALAYIEENINEPLSLKKVSQAMNISEYHFSRLFKILTGTSLKQYILGRKLAIALDMLSETQMPIIEIALDLGFEYPEVFSRAFKKYFGIAPLEFRTGELPAGQPMQPLNIIERDIINIKGSFALKENFSYRTETLLCGVYIDVNEYEENFISSLSTACTEFLAKSTDDVNLRQDIFYSIVACNKSHEGRYTVFFGKELLGCPSSWKQYTFWKQYTIPVGSYAEFCYHGTMTDMRTTFVNDFYHWVIVKEIILRNIGIGMINIYETDSISNTKILVPAHNPRTQQ